MEVEITIADIELNTNRIRCDFDSLCQPEESKKGSVASDTSKTRGIESCVINMWFGAYLNKFKGIEGKKSPKRPPAIEVLYSCIFAFFGILLVSVTGYWYLGRQFKSDDGGTAVVMLSGSFGATAVLLYDHYYSPLAQPRNVIGSYIVASFMGVSVRIVCGYIGLEYWTTAAFAVSIAILGMNLTKTIHPPAGAVALTTVIGGPSVLNMGYGFVLTSLGGAFIMTAFALLANNLVPGRQYPTHWW